MRSGHIQQAGNSLGRRQIEEILRHAGTGRDGATEQLQGPLMESEQAEDRTERIERLGVEPTMLEIASAVASA